MDITYVIVFNKTMTGCLLLLKGCITIELLDDKKENGITAIY